MIGGIGYGVLLLAPMVFNVTQKYIDDMGSSLWYACGADVRRPNGLRHTRTEDDQVL